MFIDSSLEFADATALAQAATTAKQGDAINIRSRIGDNATIDLSAGEPLFVVIELTTAITSGGSATVNIQLTTAANEALSSGAVNLWETGGEALSDLVVGKRWIISMPEGDYKAWLGIRTTIATADLTAGAFSAFITKDVSNWTSTDTRT